MLPAAAATPMPEPDYSGFIHEQFADRGRV
jgi:hypothetical protein